MKTSVAPWGISPKFIREAFSGGRFGRHPQIALSVFSSHPKVIDIAWGSAVFIREGERINCDGGISLIKNTSN